MTAPTSPATAPGTGLAVVALVGAALMTVLGLRFAAYAVRNKRANTLEAREAVWDHLVGVGVIGALYGLLAAATLADPRVALVRDAVLLALLVVVARTLASQAGQRTETRSSWRVAAVAVPVGVVAGAGLVVVGDGDPVAVASGLEGVVGVVLLGYGLARSRRGWVAGAGGTMLDTIARHLLVVFLLAGFAVAVNVAAVVGLPATLVESVRSVFVVMAATSLMTATIKLRQSVASL